MPSDLQKDIAKAYYETVVRTSESVRERAQAGYGIASAVAAALVAAGVFAGIEQSSSHVQGLGIAALAAWLGAAWLYLQAVAGHVRIQYGEVDGEPDVEDYAKAALLEASNSRLILEYRLDWAIIVTGLASLLTISTFAMALLD